MGIGLTPGKQRDGVEGFLCVRFRTAPGPVDTLQFHGELDNAFQSTTVGRSGLEFFFKGSLIMLKGK